LNQGYILHTIEKAFPGQNPNSFRTCQTVKGHIGPELLLG